MEQVKAHDDKLEMMVIGIQPMLDCVGPEQPKGGHLLGDGPYQSVVNRCRTAWMDFKEFMCSMAHGAIVHVLA